MYKENFVMSIKSGNKFLQESNNEVFLPFLSEYSIFLKNKNSKRALVSVEIDGKDVFNGEKLVLNAGQSIDLERFVEELNSGRKFRFIEKSDAIIEYRGNQPEDGLVKVSFQYEELPKTYGGSLFEKGFIDRGPTFGPTFRDSDFGIRSMGLMDTFGPTSMAINSNSLNQSSLNYSDSNNIQSQINNTQKKEGITVKGSESTQKFRKTNSFFQLEKESYVMILKLKGYSKTDTEIVEPITKKSKKICTSCGKKWPYEYTYCPIDTTFLEEE